MSKIMLVNVTHVEESRVAILENGVLEAYEIETLNRANIKGNMYNAVVENVHGSLEAAFLRLGPDLKGFLPLDEVNFRLLPVRGERGKNGRIGQHLHPGQRILAQVVREPFSGKPPTVSTYFSLPGRYLVLMPGVDSDGISRKIEDQEQRDKLKKVIEELNAPEGFGVIVRTAGVGQSKTELQRDLRYLLRLWESIKRASAVAEFPGLVYRERDLVIRTMRDYFTSDISEVWIDNPETYERALEFVSDVMPGKAKILHLYTGDRPLFSKYNLEDQIESIYQRRVPLPSGGEIIIDGTEALTAIDVNSARSARKADPEDTILQTNLEAAAEIGRQMRLRDLGGLLIVDFIDMNVARNRGKVEKAMRDAMKGDRAKSDVTKISKLGLLEIARQRIRAEKMAASYTTCPNCEGYGLVKNVEPAALSALRKLQVRCTRGDFGRMRLTVPPDVASWILNNKREDLLQLEKRQNIRLIIEAKATLLRHESEFETFAREKTEAPPALVAPDRSLPPLPPDAAELAAIEGPPPEARGAAPTRAAEPDADGGSEELTEGGRGKKRRRRRRRGRGRGEGAQVTAGEGATNGDAAAPYSDDDEEGESETYGDAAASVVGAATGDLAARGEGPRRSDRAPRVERASADGIGLHDHLGGSRGVAAQAAFEDSSSEPEEWDGSEPAVSEGDGGFEVLPESSSASAGGAAEGDHDAGRPDGSATEEGEAGGRRRRRRRRRRGKSGGGGQQPAVSAVPGGPAPVVRVEQGPAPVEVDEPYVPQGVRSEELLPAATGGRRAGGRREGGNFPRGRPRRRRGGE